MLPKRFDLAIRILLTFARSPTRYLQRPEFDPEKRPLVDSVLTDLLDARLIVSVRGRAGGYAAALPPEDIVLEDLLRLCTPPATEVCDEFRIVERLIAARLRKATLADLMPERPEVA